MRWTACVLSGLLLVAAWASAAETAPAFRFKDVTAEVVDKLDKKVGPIFDYAFLDVNDDHYLDIVTNNHHQSKPSPMWLGTAGGRFKFLKNVETDLTVIAGFWLAEGDLNGDGKTDLVFTGNEGGVKINTTGGSGPGGYRTYHSRGSSPLAVFFDVDGDGQMDMLRRPGRLERPIGKTHLNDLFGGYFVVADFDNDGWPDVYAAGSTHRFSKGPRKFYRNEKGTLKDVTEATGLLSAPFGGLVRAVDVNNDNRIDLVCGGGRFADEIPGGLTVFLNKGELKFEKLATYKVRKGVLAYGIITTGDLDNDGYIDVGFFGNVGRMFWRNQAGESFVEVKTPKFPSYRCRWDDFDHDGKLDIVIGPKGANWRDTQENVSVYRNVTESGNRWLKIKLKDLASKNTQAIGARVIVRKAGTDEILGVREVQSDSAGGHPRCHFGLGTVEMVDLEIRFPFAEKPLVLKEVRSNQSLLIHSDGQTQVLP